MSDFNIEMTQLPCGRYCGTSYVLPGLVEPVAIQQAALGAGWGIARIDGDDVLVCTKCKIDESE